MTDPSHSHENDDDLRRLLAELDPMSVRVPVEPVSSPQARHLLEQIMNETDQPSSAGDTPSGTAAIMATTPSNIRPFSRGRTWLAAAAAVAILGLGTGVAVNAGGGSEENVAIAPPTSVALTVPGGGPTMSSCLMFDVAILRDMPVALAGTVTSADAEKVTLDVDRWFKGGDADQVTIAVPEGQTSAALDGVSFEQGKRYLLTATEGTVNGCGYSGPATADYEKQFEQAFGA